MILCFCFFCVETRISQHMVRFCTGILEKILLFVQNAYDKIPKMWYNKRNRSLQRDPLRLVCRVFGDTEND